MTSVSDEMKNVFYQTQYMFDKEYILGCLIELFNDDGSYDEMLNKLRSDPALLDRVAKRYRKYVEDLYSADDEFDCLRDAFDYCDKQKGETHRG